MRVEIKRSDLKKEFRDLDIKDIDLSHVLPSIVNTNNMLIFSEGPKYWNKKVLYSKEEHECGFNPFFCPKGLVPEFRIF